MLPLDTSPEIVESAPDTALIPVGSFEQHGPHLPLTTDSLIASAITERIASDHQVLRLPVIPVSCSHEHSAFPGTVSISAATLHVVLADIMDDLRRSGISYIFIVNAHGGNYVLSNATQERSASGDRVALFPQSTDWATARTEAGLLTRNAEDMHAGEAETSILLCRYPEAVRASYAHDLDHVVEDRRFMLSAGLDYYAPDGVVGRPSLATAEKGERLLASFSRQFSRYLALLRSL